MKSHNAAVLLVLFSLLLRLAVPPMAAAVAAENGEPNASPCVTCLKSPSFCSRVPSLPAGAGYHYHVM